MTEKNLLTSLEQLRDLIDVSITVLQKNEGDFRGIPLSLNTTDLNPVHQSTNIEVRKALRTISSSSQMLRALADPQTVLNDVYMGFHDGTALLVCVQADVANILGEQSMHIDEIAKKADIESDKLARYMRNLCNNYVFREVAPGIFANTSLSGVLREEGKRAHVAHCLDLVRKSSCKAWDALTLPEYRNSDAPDKTAFNLAYNTNLKIFQYLSDIEPEIGKRTKVAFATGTRVNNDEYLAVYPWAREGNAKIVDVGGGFGGGTMPVIKAFKQLQLVVQDIPDTRPNFEKVWKDECPEAIQDGRVRFDVHDFFTPQTEEADIYYMRHVIHDWPDAESIKILANTAANMGSLTKLLICEHVVLPSYRSTLDSNGEDRSIEDDFTAPEPLLANWGAAHTSRLDLQVLACLNARQRTQTQYISLCQRAGLEVVRFWRNTGPLVIIECRKL